MFSYQLYNLLHIVGLALVMVALGGIASTAALASRPTSGVGGRRRTAAFHALGIFLILLGGFGMLARLGVMHGAGFPGWIWAKLGIWAVLAAAVFVPYRYPRAARPLLAVVPALAGLAAYMAIYKPL
jgi:hypothetical protein